MKRFACAACVAALLASTAADAGFFGDLSRKVTGPLKKQATLDENIIAKGLKEALAIGTERAVKEVAKQDGYFGDALIKILLPPKMQQAADLLAKVGYQQQVDDLVLSMNRAAEKAAPKAAKYFGDAIRHMSVEDAKGILRGGDTAASQFFEKKTRSQLFEEFRPTVAESMKQVGVARAYQEMIGRYENIPFASLVGLPSLDLDTYVTNKALDGLFIKVSEEEKRIRKNPAARTTDLLRKVFGRL
ncbi:DUF4197 domain-containing protein [Geomonas sp. RF6]|uniref:DUF4197 domain-containing protein n=1 Tax=Geomonas sp. RF6 TaxID=2897342 RepID=UPI001E28B709|nr:DUF4197 domain-containing protein [Geomonas sp. RF6]UFS68796.1 DUF4197 domain-containing protein [Geomonas sp. RF6]